jgi:microcystin degradation protein MlrC
MKFLIGMFAHESNCFCAHPTGEDEFKQLELIWGEGLLEAHRDKRTVLGGFIDELEGEGHQVIGSVSAMAVPSGPIETNFYKRIKRDIVESVQKVGQLDGVLLSLHGAMNVEEKAEIFDPEGDIVTAVREAVGSDLPIAVVLDLHSDTTDLLIENTDISLAYNEEPHRDAYERGLEAARLILRTLRDEIHPTSVRERVPMLLPAINMATDKGPLHDLHLFRKELETTPGVIDISLHAGFYGADQPEVGFSIVCTTDNNQDLARTIARQMAEVAWKKREEFIVSLTPIDEAVRQALFSRESVGLIDEADDPAGGGAADSVAILRGMIEGGVQSGGISTVKDTEVIREMARLGEGKRITVLLGGKTDNMHGKPLHIEGIVRNLHRAPIQTDTWSGKLYDVGVIGVLDVNGILVLVTEQKVITENIDLFEILGYDVRKLQAVCFKGLGLHIRQALEGKIQTFIPVDGIGVTHPDVRKLGPYRRIRRPVWPLDDIPMNSFPDW